MKDLKFLQNFLVRLFELFIVALVSYMFIPLVIFVISLFNFEMLQSIVTSPEYGALGTIITILAICLYVSVKDQSK